MIGTSRWDNHTLCMETVDSFTFSFACFASMKNSPIHRQKTRFDGCLDNGKIGWKSVSREQSKFWSYCTIHMYVCGSGPVGKEGYMDKSNPEIIVTLELGFVMTHLASSPIMRNLSHLWTPNTIIWLMIGLWDHCLHTCTKFIKGHANGQQIDSNILILEDLSFHINARKVVPNRIQLGTCTWFTHEEHEAMRQISTNSQA